MPNPVYLICSESGSVDETTKLTSFFNLVEKIQIARIPIAGNRPIIVGLASVRISGFWMREEGDLPEAEFEVHFVGHFPGQADEIPLAQGRFRFTSPFQRMNILGLQLTTFFGPGTLRIEARLRRAGEDAWLNRMTYPILLEEIPAPAGVPLTAPEDPPAAP